MKVVIMLPPKKNLTKPDTSKRKDHRESLLADSQMCKAINFSLCVYLNGVNGFPLYSAFQDLLTCQRAPQHELSSVMCTQILKGLPIISLFCIYLFGLLQRQHADVCTPMSRKRATGNSVSVSVFTSETLITLQPVFPIFHVIKKRLKLTIQSSFDLF